MSIVLHNAYTDAGAYRYCRMLLTGVCQGESPEAFTRRRKEIDAAKMAKRLEDFRKAEKAAGNMAAKKAAVRRKNADLIAAKVRATLNHAPATAAAGSAAAAVESDREESVVCVPGGVGFIAKKIPAKSVPEIRSGSVSVTDSEDEIGEPVVEGVFDENNQVEGFGTERGEGASGVVGDAVSDSVGVEGGGDIRDYRQAFQGFKSAYSAYYSVFGSQVRTVSFRSEKRDVDVRESHLEKPALTFTPCVLVYVQAHLLKLFAWSTRTTRIDRAQ